MLSKTVFLWSIALHFLKLLCVLLCNKDWRKQDSMQGSLKLKKDTSTYTENGQLYNTGVLFFNFTVIVAADERRRLLQPTSCHRWKEADGQLKIFNNYFGWVESGMTSMVK